MTKTFCDKCGKETHHDKLIYVSQRFSLEQYKDHFRCEICPDCLKELQEWMKEKNKLT